MHVATRVREALHPAHLLGSLLFSIFLLFTACERGPDPAADIWRVEDGRADPDGVLAFAAASEDPALRARSALAMGRIQDPSFASTLANLAGLEEEKEVRLAALFALGQLGLSENATAPPEALQAVRAATEDGDPEVVATATEALGKLASPEASEALVRLLSSPQEGVRVEAVMGLFRLRYVPLWRRQVETAPELSAAATKALLGALTDPSAEVRWRVAHAVSRYAEPAASEALTGVLGDENEWVRLFAARALGSSGNDASVPSLVGLLGDGSPRVRIEALRALAARGAAEQIPSTLAQDGSPHVRAALAGALAASNSEASLVTLHNLIKDDSATVRAAASGALIGRLGERFSPLLEGVLAGEGWVEKVAVVPALANWGEQGEPLLRRAFADTDARVRAAAVGALGQARLGLDLLREALGSDDLAIRGAAVAAVGDWNPEGSLALLTEALENSPGVDWIEVREALAAALAEVEGGEAWLEQLALGDPAPSVRSRAETLLAKKGIQVASSMPVASTTASPFLGQTFSEDPVVIFETEKGTFSIRCLAEHAPIHVANFLSLVEEGFYDGLIWHRVVPNFVIQGGDPRGDGWGGAGYTLRDEIHAGARYLRGAVGMPKAGKDTGGSQLFITHIPTPHLDGNYTIFGQVTSGLEVIDAIEIGDRILTATLQE